MKRIVVMLVVLFAIGVYAQEKQCAFGFTPVMRYGAGDSRPPSPKEVMQGALGPQFYSTPAVAVYHSVCPYEKAVELFGQARVSYKLEFQDCKVATENIDCKREVRQILVDGEVAYEQEPQKPEEPHTLQDVSGNGTVTFGAATTITGTISACPPDSHYVFNSKTGEWKCERPKPVKKPKK